MKKQLLSVFFMLFLGALSAQKYHYDFNDNCSKAYQKMIKLQMDSARYYMALEQKQHPDNLIPVLLENYHDFLRIVLTEDQALFEELKDHKKIRLNQWKEGPEDSPWYLSGQAQIKLQWAFSRVLFDEYFTAATEINSAYHMLEENHQLHPDFLADNMGIGILHAMIGVIPDQYQWALEMLGIYGSIEQGVSEIKKQLDEQKDHFFSVEALFYYSFVRLNLQTDSSRFNELLNYYETEPYISLCKQSPLLSFSYAVVLLKIDNDRAIDFLRELHFEAHQIPLYYNTYLLGQALLYQLNPSSFSYLEEYINHYSGKNYKKSALQRQAWSRFIEGDTLDYKKLMRRVLITGTELMDADKSAQKEALAAEVGYLPNLHLLKSRMQFDGHYYQGALSELDKMPLHELSQEDLLEYHYRKGRIYHEMHQFKWAKKAYQSALKEGKDEESYFAANACLKLGEINEEQRNWNQAMEYYEICLELDFTEYRRGIRAKAKAGLQRVERMLE